MPGATAGHFKHTLTAPPTALPRPSPDTLLGLASLPPPPLALPPRSPPPVWSPSPPCFLPFLSSSPSRAPSLPLFTFLSPLTFSHLPAFLFLLASTLFPFPSVFFLSPLLPSYLLSSLLLLLLSLPSSLIAPIPLHLSPSFRKSHFSSNSQLLSLSL